MAIKIGKTGKNLNVKQDVKNSEVDSDLFDIDVQEVGEDANVTQNLAGVKSKKTIVWIITAIGVAIAAALTAYFTNR